MTLLLLVACAREPWTADAALAPHLARLDADRDGRVVAAEYTRTRREGPPFATVDRDGDGALGAAELAWLVRAQSPATFDGDTRPAAALPAPDRGDAPTGEARDVWELLVWMGDALRSAGRPGPDPAAVEAAVRSGRLDSAETRAVLAPLRPEWEARGWRWPEGL